MILKHAQTRDGIRIHQEADFAGMHKAGNITARILDEIAEHVFPQLQSISASPFVQPSTPIDLRYLNNRRDGE